MKNAMVLNLALYISICLPQIAFSVAPSQKEICMEDAGGGPVDNTMAQQFCPSTCKNNKGFFKGDWVGSMECQKLAKCTCFFCPANTVPCKNYTECCATAPLLPLKQKPTAPLLPLKQNTPPPGPYQQNGTCVNIRFDGKILSADCKAGAGAANPADVNKLIPNKLDVSKCSAGATIINCKGNLRCTPCN